MVGGFLRSFLLLYAHAFAVFHWCVRHSSLPSLTSCSVLSRRQDDWAAIGTCAALFGLEDEFDDEKVPPEALHYAYVDAAGEPAISGEVSEDEIKELLASGSIDAATTVWR